MDKSTGRLKAVAAYAKSVGIAADQLINAVLGGRLKPCPSAPTASACWMAGQVGGASFGSSTHCFGGRKTIAGAHMPPPSTDAHTKTKALPTYGRAESTNDKTAARRCCPHRAPRQPQQRQRDTTASTPSFTPTLRIGRLQATTVLLIWRSINCWPK